ncbi:MAG TPA: MBOAT family protein [Deltaproteobacteria bacterium]|nr:MBOAT family protein [Deltaproteobacteria bacterium]
MLFHSIEFLQLFVVTFVLYWSLKSQRLRLGTLVLASVYFYARWNPWLVFLLIFTALFDFSIARGIERAQSQRVRRALLVLSLCVSLGLLGFFKYTNFLLGLVWPAVRPFGVVSDPPFLKIILPLGISFYTFETISYVVDVYRRRIPAERRLLNYMLFLMFFPHLIAGPIVRPGDFLPQLERLRRFDWSRIELGARLFLLGLLKKAVIADQLAQVVDPVYAAPAGFGSGAVWVATLAYAIQIYCDFSGYSDMAIGCAHCFGLKLPRNFNLPYLSQNVAEVWTRWHISFSTWLRDYLYIPLGGNRGGRLATYWNLIVTMLLGGLWHGAGLTYVCWGLYHGILLALHRAVPLPRWVGHTALAPLRIAVTFLLWCFGVMLFRAQNLGDAGVILLRMLVPTRGAELAPSVALVFGAIFAVVLIASLAGRFLDVEASMRRAPVPLAAGALAVGLLLAQILSPNAGGAFIYFQF